MMTTPKGNQCTYRNVVNTVSVLVVPHMSFRADCQSIELPPPPMYDPTFGAQDPPRGHIWGEVI